MFFSYEIKGTTALFHSVIATISMCLSELVIVGIVSNLATNYYKSDTYLKNLIFLTYPHLNKNVKSCKTFCGLE